MALPKPDLQRDKNGVIGEGGRTVRKPAQKPIDDNTGGIIPSGFEDSVDPFYKPNVRNWYKSFPYGFRFTDRYGKKTTFFLPINPSNITKTTHFATNIITTLYGVVEEHSEVRYHDIVISGTTGMAPRYVSPLFQSPTPNAGGRSSFPVFRSVLAGFAGRTEGILRNALGSVNNIVNTAGKQNEQGIRLDETGYMAFHNLYRYFLLYKKDTAGEPKVTNGKPQTKQRGGHPLIYLNHKDGIQYNVAITRFDLTKDASQPFLYNYRIVMRAYNMKPISGVAAEAIDIAGDLGLGEVTSLSIFAAMRRISRNAKNAVGGVKAGISGLGS